MGIMHPRVAHNYLKDGYYPTDDATLDGIAELLTIESKGCIRVIDPCCGTGAALQRLCQHLETEVVQYGIELDAGRAEHAQIALDQVLHANTFDCVVGSRSMSLMFLNPPYGDTVTDQLGMKEQGMDRLEVQFTRRCLGMLKREGVMVLVIPKPSLTRAFCSYLAKNLGSMQVFSAATDRFKQVVIIGYRRDMAGDVNRIQRTFCRNQLVRIGLGEEHPLPFPLLEWGAYTPFRLTPLSDKPFRFETVTPNKQQLSAVFSAHKGLWHRFDSVFTQAYHRDIPRPLKKLSPWHLSLSLAAGQISGLVSNNDGSRHLLVKGGTKKVQKTMTSVDENSMTTTKIDQFVPTIRAIDITPGERFGDIIVIQ